jgi:hypothetical protein
MKKDFITVAPDRGNGNATVIVTADKNLGDARRTSLSVSGGGMNRTININQEEVERFTAASAPNGVYILSTDKFVYKRSVWDTANNSKAVGVAVKTATCSFVIAPVEQTAIQWGGYGTLISGCTTAPDLATAKKDYKGEQNTDAIIAQLGTSIEYAVKYCRNYTFKNGKKGYLPTLGELNEAYQNKSEVDACMSLIGGKALDNSSTPSNYRKWSSTQYDSNYAWCLDWKDGAKNTYYKDYRHSFYCARPFAKLM